MPAASEFGGLSRAFLRPARAAVVATESVGLSVVLASALLGVVGCVLRHRVGWTHEQPHSAAVSISQVPFSPTSRSSYFCRRESFMFTFCSLQVTFHIFSSLLLRL